MIFALCMKNKLNVGYIFAADSLLKIFLPKSKFGDLLFDKFINKSIGIAGNPVGIAGIPVSAGFQKRKICYDRDFPFN